MVEMQNGVKVIAPPEDTGSTQKAECVVLDTFTTIRGNKRTTYGLLFKVETSEFLTAIAEHIPEVIKEDEIPETKWAICTVEHDLKCATDKFYAARMGTVTIKQTGVVTVIV